MEHNPKRIDTDDTDKLPESDTSTDLHRHNPGLKGDTVQKRSGDKNERAVNEDPPEEHRVIEETSEDRLSEAE